MPDVAMTYQMQMRQLSHHQNYLLNNVGHFWLGYIGKTQHPGTLPTECSLPTSTSGLWIKYDAFCSAMPKIY